MADRNLVISPVKATFRAPDGQRPLQILSRRQPTSSRPPVTGENTKSCHTACIPAHAHLVKGVNYANRKLENKPQETVANPRNMSEIPDLDAIGTAGKADYPWIPARDNQE